MLQKKRLTPQQALQHAKQYCAYQERSHTEVKEKLYSFGLFTGDVEKILSELIQEDYLNEERFARSFARGKFRMKKWGRMKIKFELKGKQVSEYCIRKGLTEIDEEEYHQTILKLAEEKLKSLKSEKNIFTKKKKAQDFLLQKGYERDQIISVINKFFSR